MLDDKTESTKPITHNQNDIDNANGDIVASQDKLNNVIQGDLYVLGKVWVDVVKTGLLGSKTKIPSIVPKVEAAPPPVPQKPPKMKYKDLPLYSAPHYEYKDYLADKIRTSCPQAKKKLIHDYLLPHVSSCRKKWQQNCKDFCEEYNSMKKDAAGKLAANKNKFKRYMRDDRNLTLRKGVLVFGGLTGYYIGSKKTQVTPRIFLATVGLLAAGALCFPKDTDETFRAFMYTTGKVCIGIYNKFCGKDFALRERLACERDLPPPPGPRKSNVCPQLKK